MKQLLAWIRGRRADSGKVGPRWTRVRRWVHPGGRHTFFLWFPTLLNYAGLIFFVLTWHTTTVWLDTFNLNIPSDQRIVRAMLGARLETYPTELRLRFKANDITPTLGVLFNYQGGTQSGEGIRLSSFADNPTVWIRGTGENAEVQPLADTALLTAREVVFRFANDRVAVEQNGSPLYEGPLKLESPTVHLIADPSMRIGAWRSPWSALESFVVRLGNGTEAEFVPDHWLVMLRRAGALILATVLFWIGDGMLASAARGRKDPPGIRAQVISMYPAVPMVVVLFFAIYNNLPGQKANKNLYGAYMDDGYFNVRAFEARRELARADRKIFFPVESNSDVILVFGGVPAAGDPTTKTGPTWPAMLQTRFDEIPAFPEYRFKVVNLSDPMYGIEAQFPPGIQPFLKSVQPRVVIFNTLQNDFFIIHDNTRIAYNMGYYQTAIEEEAEESATFLAHMQYALSLVRESGALAIVMDEPMDLRAIGRDPLDKWRRPFLEQAVKFGAIVIRTQDDFSSRKDRWLFYDYDLPSRSGQQLLAQRVYDTLVQFRERIPPPLASLPHAPVPEPTPKK